VPGLWRAFFAGDNMLPLVALGLGVRYAWGLAMGMHRGKVPSASDGLFSVAVIAGSVAFVWWHVSRIRLAFRQGREIVARVTHFDKMDLGRSGSWVPLPSYILGVAYEVQGAECTVGYTLHRGDANRLQVTVGGTVVLIQHPQLEKPLLRDLYLDPDPRRPRQARPR
jgi:hypothetical protein